MVTTGGIISPYLLLPFNLESNEMKLAVQTPFPDLVVVVVMQTYQAIERATASGEKVGQLNAAELKSRDSTSASTYGGEVTLQPRACW